RLGTENVDHIEIIQGAASAKYGSDAIGGVINVVTKKAAKTPGLQVNAEGRRTKGDGDLFPYQNFFLRADSGQVGKARFSVYGSKREILPVYSTTSFSGFLGDPMDGAGDAQQGGRSIRNSLRYYGDIKNIGFMGSVDLNDRNTIDFSMDKTSEDMERYVKHGNDAGIPQIHYKRDVDRNTYRLSYKGNNGGSTDWHVDVNYAKMNEDDITLTNYYANDSLTGHNTLNYVDDLEHKQWNVSASANTQLNDDHLLTYGFGYTKETGEGSRLKSAPETTTRYIDPWDYDKNLIDEKNMFGTSVWPASTIHDYAIKYVNGIPQIDWDKEHYGDVKPIFTYEDYQDLKKLGIDGLTTTQKTNLHTFVAQMASDARNSQNMMLEYWKAGQIDDAYMVAKYYEPPMKNDPIRGPLMNLSFNGQTYGDSSYRDNRITSGRAEIKKHHFYIGDTWQVNDDTILSPLLRLDHSDLFGTNATFNLGLTHNLGGNQHRRFKANVGTGYTEPGMGELYYNWEMYSGTPVGEAIGKLGYYWIGNPDLKPEKSVNFDIGIEGENGNTSARLNVFHNKIDDYMTTYFTGEIMDFHPGASTLKFIQPPDMIYSFKNIGEAEITGVEAEINHRFNKHWSGKLGYTYLHAVNKSDPDMPDQLLDKPQHKVDIGVTYENAGWTASLWGDYYIHMLDSNAISNNGNYMESDDHTVHYFFKDKSDWTYQKKTFGLWNFLLSKQIDKDSTVYVGVDNLFNHRDDDQAFMERVYKFGVNLKFGPGGETLEKELDKAAGKAVVEDTTKPLDTDWFIQKPFDTEKEPGVEVIGDYRARWNSFTGEIKASEARVTPTASVGSAYKNYLEKAEHGFEQRLRLGLDARIGENTNVKILGSASGMTGVDTMHDVSDSKGLNHQRLDNIDITQHANKWDFSIGRLTEPMGVTGYWFGKEYDGARAVWTSGNTQVRLGYGDFSVSTGITDSAYTHATRTTFQKYVTKDEWLGFAPTDDVNHGNDKQGYWNGELASDGYEGLYQKLQKATSLAEEKQIIDSYLQVLKEKDTAQYETLQTALSEPVAVTLNNTFAWQKITVYSADGSTVVGTYLSPVELSADKNITYGQLFDQAYLETVGTEVWQNAAPSFEQNSTIAEKTELVVPGIDYSEEYVLPGGTYQYTSEFYGYGKYTGSESLYELGGNSYKVLDFKEDIIQKLTPEEAQKQAVQSMWDKSLQQQYATYSYSNDGGVAWIRKDRYDLHSSLSQNAVKVLKLVYNNWRLGEELSDFTETLPFLGLGTFMGTVIVQDQIPSIERAAFVQAKHQFGDNFGVQAWYLRSLGDDTHSIRYADERRADLNNTASFDELANVIGLGARYRFGRNASISFDWGQNRTDFGRFMNGSTIYTHTAGTSDFSIDGRTMGGTPRFWTVRFDIGRADTDVPGSWNAFADYKYFEHGSFFGGNGTEGVPDRYLDGIKSFTIGGGYVPAKDVLLEAFYTFGAKGIGTRDTLYGSEHFELGDYTRLQATFKF
ncbi:TonB-dependent siderophore receptor, partial [uncultured Megasphaera sp.]|uniref:TonB-dependent receptor plug domain-containing protein n=1 Tax=uncultured Megasphaera sp. TaxID=165188 RepID=UPI00265900C9